MRQIDVTLPGRTYPILIGPDALRASAGALSDLTRGRKAAVVSDETVWRLHGEALETVLRGAGAETHPVVVPPGEASKSMDTLTRLYHEFFRFGLTRSDIVVTFGGGVVGDLGGFAAATYMRGVPFVQIPTTLLAQVDASVGGKVAVNLPEGKNLIGCFYQPRMVLADTELLRTLPAREWTAGMAEVVKYAALGEAALPALLETPGGIQERLEEIVALCCACKAAYVEEDERDTGTRMMLNFGHTFGHAIEKRHGFETYNHGEAVAVGMALAARTGTLLGLSRPGTEEQLLRLMNACGLSCTAEDTMEDLVPLMAGDKKNSGAALTLVLLRDMGKPFAYRIESAALLKLFGEADGDGRR